MFTGLIEDLGEFLSIERQGKAAKLTVLCSLPTAEIALGDSIAVNGTCLTVESIHGKTVQFHCLAETLNVTNLGSCRRGDRLNLERAMQLGGRMGGHIVSGHVDFCGKVLFAGKRGEDFQLEVAFPGEQRDCLVRKGSVAVNGVSLTIAELGENSFTICIIPVTQSKTNIDYLKAGDMVNVETDVIGKYVAAVMSRSRKEAKISMKTLAEAGFL